MTRFDLPTAFVIMGGLYLFMPLAVWYALRGTKARSVANWCMGGLMFGLGLCLVGQRGRWPEWLTFECAALLINGAQLIRVAALRRELKRPVPLLLMGGLWLAYGLIYTVMRQADDVALRLHYPLSLLFLSIYLFWIAALALQLSRQERLVSGLWLALAYGPLASVVAVQIYRFFDFDGSLHPLVNDWSSIALVLSGNLTAVVGHMAYMSIYVERAIRKQTDAAAEKAKAAEIQRLERQIGQLDRVRGLGMVSASLAHELSQPLASLQLIAGQAQMEIRSGRAEPEKTASHLAKILEFSVHTREVIHRIRSYVQNEATSRGPVDLIQVHQTVRSLLSHVLQSQGAELVLSAPADLPMVSADRVQLAQVLLNVYRNATEAIAGREGGRIEVQIEAQGDRVEITVIDNGPGFDAQAMERGNEGFFSTKSGGLGMGLLISRQIIEAHDGKFGVSNRPEGGACVRLSLQLASSRGGSNPAFHIQRAAFIR